MRVTTHHDFATLTVIPTNAGIQFKYASEGHHTGFECFAQRI